MALSSFITPKGTFCSITVIPNQVGAQIYFGQNKEQFGSVQEASAYLNNIINTINTYSGALLILDMRLVSGYLITGIYPRQITMAWTGSAPQPFDLVTGIQVFGLGFTPAACGFLFLEDTTGGTDSNGFFLRLNYVSPTQLVSDGTGNTGDAAMTAVMLVYYQDVSEVRSNVLNGVGIGSGSPFSVYV